MAGLRAGVKLAGRRALTRLGGRRLLQPLFETLHEAALLGRNYGGGDLHDSGELAFLARLQVEGWRPAVVLDVGANTGAWSRAARLRFPQARIIAFEPAPEVFSELRDGVRGLEVETVPVALGSATGQQDLHLVAGMSGLSSLVHRDLDHVNLAVTGSVRVDVTTLDAYCAAEGIEHVDLLKVDAEGYDLEVLRGATALLGRGAVEIVQFEFGGGNLDSRTYLRDFLEVLQGYQVHRLLKDGLAPVHYSEREEVFIGANYVARRIHA